MRSLLVFIILLIGTPALAAEPQTLLDTTEKHGTITAHFSLSGTTLTKDDAGQMQVSPVDRLQATLSVEAPESLTIILPVFPGATFGDFTLIDQGKSHRARTNNITTTTSWLIEPYNEGEYSLPPLTIIGTSTQNNKESLTLKLPAIQVINLTSIDTDFDLLPARQTSQSNIKTILFMAGGSIILALLLVLCLKNKRQPQPLSPKQYALKKLMGLTGTNKKKTQRLSYITRQFLDNNFTLCTLEKTYSEYAPVIIKHPHMQGGAVVLNILKICDQSNYSNAAISDEDISRLLQQTEDFIKDCPEPLRPEEQSATCGRL